MKRNNLTLTIRISPAPDDDIIVTSPRAPVEPNRLQVPEMAVRPVSYQPYELRCAGDRSRRRRPPHVLVTTRRTAATGQRILVRRRSMGVATGWENSNKTLVYQLVQAHVVARTCPHAQWIVSHRHRCRQAAAIYDLPSPCSPRPTGLSEHAVCWCDACTAHTAAGNELHHSVCSCSLARAHGMSLMDYSLMTVPTK
ncbi:unnamed protein product [Sphagnum balticum]